jgi:co-chaperonin GroES (HSP10)
MIEILPLAFGKHIIVRQIESEVASESVILSNQDDALADRRGLIIAVGVELMNDGLMAGQVVRHNKYSGLELTWQHETFLVLTPEQILAVEPPGYVPAKPVPIAVVLEEAERCPSCGSDDPVKQLREVTGHHRGRICRDPWHARLPAASKL